MERNNTVDLIRGMAILMVVMGHAISAIPNGEKTMAMNIIWTLQMPLFMLISGYVQKFSAPINTFNDFCFKLWKRTYSYLLPWMIWIWVIKYFFKAYNITPTIPYIDYLIYTIFHLDSGLWFTFTLWTLTLIYLSASFVSKKFRFKNFYLRTLLLIFMIGVFTLPFLLLGWRFGLNFLGIKFTLYYLPFYVLGTQFGEYEDWINKIVKLKTRKG